MAEERVDPFGRVGALSLDHIARYFWAGHFTSGKDVLDAACGTGFGAHMLASRTGARVLGVDRDAVTVAEAARRYAHPDVRFQVMDLMDDAKTWAERFDCVVSFETLEHLPDPEKALRVLAPLLKDGGVFIASVPGEGDADQENPFHLRHFTAADFKQLVEGVFPHAHVFRQDFQLASGIVPDTPEDGPAAAGDGQPRIAGHEACSHELLLGGNSGAGGPPPDTRLVVASTQPLRNLPPPLSMLSREIWQALCGEMEAQRSYGTGLREHAEALNAQFRRLQKQFDTVNAWGKYHYVRATGKQPPAQPENSPPSGKDAD